LIQTRQGLLYMYTRLSNIMVKYRTCWFWTSFLSFLYSWWCWLAWHHHPATSCVTVTCTTYIRI
jgi:hypothetical protein